MVYMPYKVGHCRQILYSLVAQTVNSLSAVQEIQLPSLGWEDQLENGMKTTSLFFSGTSHEWRSLWAPIHGVAKSQT